MLHISEIGLVSCVLFLSTVVVIKSLRCCTQYHMVNTSSTLQCFSGNYHVVHYKRVMNFKLLKCVRRRKTKTGIPGNASN